MYLIFVLFRVMYNVQTACILLNVLSTSTRFGVRRSGRRRSTYIRLLVAGRQTFSFCRNNAIKCAQLKCLWAPYPVHYSIVHSHSECVRVEMDTLWDVCQQLVVERLHPKCVTTLKNVYSSICEQNMYMYICICTYPTVVLSVTVDHSVSQGFLIHINHMRVSENNLTGAIGRMMAGGVLMAVGVFILWEKYGHNIRMFACIIVTVYTW